MARQLRVEFPGAIYHVTCRMIGDHRLDRSRLFVDDRDRVRFVDRLADRVEQYNIRLYRFVLMTNHFHLVFPRYVHLNPVKVGPLKKAPIEQRIEALRAYGWSSYPGYIGKRKPFAFVHSGPVLAQTGGKQDPWARRYRAFVETGLAEDDEEFKAVLKSSPRSIGGEGFRVRMDERYQKMVEGRHRPEDVAFRRVTQPLPAEVILKALAGGLGEDVEAFRQRRRTSALRAVAVRMLVRYGAQTQRQAAQHLGMGTGGAASAQARRLPGLLAQSRTLRRQVEQMEHAMERLRQERHPGAGERVP